MLSVVILSYNTRDVTLKCLSSLYRSKNVEFEVILVDNASADDTVEAVKKRFSKVKVVENRENVGFARGNNQGMEMARGEKILLLNSDAFVFEKTLEEVSKFLDSRVNVDVVGCKLLNRDGTLQPSWGFFPTVRRVAQMMVFLDNLPIVRNVIDSIHIRSEKRHSVDRAVDWVTGACVLLKKTVFEKVGGIDEKYFMYGEEMEWMYRIKKAGFQTWYTPTAECIHLMGASSKDRSVAIIGEIKGWVYWFNKHNDAWQQKALALVVMLGCVMRMVLKPKNKKAYKEAFNEIQNAVFGQSN